MHTYVTIQMCPEIKSKILFAWKLVVVDDCITSLFVSTGLLCENIAFLWNQMHCCDCFFMKYDLEAS